MRDFFHSSRADKIGMDNVDVPARAEPLDIAATLDAIAHAARRALNADRATCYANDVARHVVSGVHTTETDPKRRAFLDAAIGRGVGDLPLWRLVADGNDPLLMIEDVATAHGIPEPLRRGLRAGSVLGVRLEHADLLGPAGQPALLGTLFCSFAEARRFTPADRTMVSGLANLACVALANAHLRREATHALEDSAQSADLVRRQADFHSALIGAMQDGLAVITPDGRIVEVNARLATMTGYTEHELTAAPAWSVVWVAEELDAVMRHLAAVLASGAAEIDLTLQRKDGGRFPAIVSVSHIADDDGSTTAYVATIKDVTHRRQAEEEIRAAAERNEALAIEQAALRRVATAVAEDLAPERVFALVAEEASRVLGADSGAVVRFETSEIGVVVGSWANDPGLRREEGSYLPLRGESATAQVAGDGRPSRVDDYSQLDRETRAALGRMPFRCGLAAPIRAGADLWGALTVQSRTSATLPPLSEERLADFAELVGMAIANADVFAQLARQAETDPLTELPNRRALERELETAVETARIEGRTLAVLVLDLDDFKRVNDLHGHETGDSVLRSVARSLEAGLRPCDIAGRLGGEEFLVIMPDTGTRGAAMVAERLRSSLAQIRGAGEAPVTASLGVATFPGHGSTAGEVLRAADAAMYQAKGLGRNRTVVFNPAAARTGAEKAAQAQADLHGFVRSVLALAAALDERDPYTHEHSRTVAGYAAAIGVKLGLDGDRLEDLRIAGLLHDVGKVGVSDAVLRKPGALTDEEWDDMRRHPEIGARLLAHPGLARVREWVLHHHERPDGRGYPGGVVGEAIPLEACILAVADAYEAMTSDRPYRNALTFEAACEELRNGRGAQFDGRVVDAFLSHLASQAADEMIGGATSAPRRSRAPETAASEGPPAR
jgi:diguanylate cyclase (GGDEF)-like protein/PAS domain S-box-containing protein